MNLSLYSSRLRCGYVAIILCISLVVGVDRYSRVMSRLLASTKLDFLVESDVSAETPSKAARSGTTSRALHWLGVVPPYGSSGVLRRDGPSS